MKCEFCNSDIPEHRINIRNKTGGMLKYCSELCNKRAWYVRNTNHKNPIINWNGDTESCSQKGFYWELYICKKFDGKISNTNEIDVIINGENIDVKSSNLLKTNTKYGLKTRWRFNRGKFKQEINYLICICHINMKVIKIYKIPSDKFPKNGITIENTKFKRAGCKYDIYLI